jgi:hypothetical protein
MDDLDKEINYYQKMLGLGSDDPSTRNQKKQLKEELETDNMFDLFTCVDGILGEDYAFFNEDEDNEMDQSLLRKREPKKTKTEIIREQDLGNYN